MPENRETTRSATASLRSTPCARALLIRRPSSESASGGPAAISGLPAASPCRCESPWTTDTDLPRAANDGYVELAYLLAQRVPIQPEQAGRANLVAARGLEGQLDQRPLDLAQDPAVKAARRQIILVRGEVVTQMPLGGRAEGFARRRGRGQIGQLHIDDLEPDHVVAVEYGHAADEVLELPHISRPAVGFEP